MQPRGLIPVKRADAAAGWTPPSRQVARSSANPDSATPSAEVVGGDVHAAVDLDHCLDHFDANADRQEKRP